MIGSLKLHYIDIAIIATYLLLCVVVGLLKFDKIKTLRDYTLGVKPFSNTLLFSTVFATAIGLNRTVGVVEQSYKLGLVYIAPLLASPLIWFLLSKVISPNMDLFKQQRFMSLGDMMEYWYGKTGRWITNITSVFVTVAVTAASILGIGYLCNQFFGVSPVYGEIIAVIIITTYSALGGVQAVAHTDLFQMLIFFVALPVICAIGLSKAGGISNVLNSLPATHLKIDSSNVVLFSSFILYALVPVSTIPYIQRALIAKDKVQLTQTFNATGIGIFLFLLCMALMGLIVYTLNPNINPNAALYYFMSTYLHPGILGVVIAGLLAVIMSTQDSYLNTTSALISKDICKEIWPNLSDKAQLLIARLSCVVITSSALSVSFAKDSVLGTFWLAENFWDPLVTVPLIAGLLGIKILKKDFIYLAIICSIAVIGTRIITGDFDTRSFSVGVGTSIFILCIARKRFKAVFPDASPSKIPEALAYLKQVLTTRSFNSGSVYVFSITTLVSLTATIFVSPNEYSLFINASAAVLCALLLFNELWSNKMRELLLQKFWYCTLLFCLPLLSSYPLFIGKFDSVLALNFVLSLCLLYMLVSPVTFVTLTGVGAALGYLVATYSGMPFVSGVSTDTFGLYSCFFTVVSILMQIYNKSYVSRAVHTEVARVLQDKVAERTAELQLALVAKKEFLSKVSHEVRTPLQGIIGVSQELVESWESLKDNEKYDLAKVIARSGDRLMELMSNILDLSKFTAGQIEPKFEPNVNVTQLIEDAIKYGEKLVISQSKNISFKTEIGYGITTRIECDAMRIRQVLVNLINNAVSYSKSGEIVVRVGSDNGQLLVSVIDQGVGIPDNEKIMIFEAFTQSSLTHDLSKGKGLGLALCREIINMHNGRIWVESNEDSGSRFSFSIPYEQTTKGQTQAIGSKAASLKILLVDDEPICLQAGGMYMSSMGFEVVTVSGGVPALEYLKAHPNDIDLVLLDLMMPDMYGLNVLEAIKADSSLQHIHVVIQSALLDGHEIEKAKRLGASGFLPKPYNKAMINNTIVKLLQPEDYAEAA